MSQPPTESANKMMIEEKIVYDSRMIKMPTTLAGIHPVDALRKK